MKGFKDSTKVRYGDFDFGCGGKVHVRAYQRGGPVKKDNTLSAKERSELPKSDFGLPGSRKYPMPDKAHAANAKARATQMVKAGKLSESSKAKIDAKANKILNKAEGGAISAKTAVHKHERHMHPGKPLTKLARGGVLSAARHDSPLIGR